MWSHSIIIKLLLKQNTLYFTKLTQPNFIATVTNTDPAARAVKTRCFQNTFPEKTKKLNPTKNNNYCCIDNNHIHLGGKGIYGTKYPEQ